MGHFGQQPPRQVLLDYPPGLPPAGQNGRELGAAFHGDCALLCRAKGALPMSDRLRAFFSRLRAVFSKARLDDDFNEELAAHVDLLTSENEKAGMTPQEARRAALVRLGGGELTREIHRKPRGLPFLEMRSQNQSFSDMAGYFAFYGVGDSKLTGSGEPERLTSVPVSENFFPVLGVQAQLGRLFKDDECKWNGPRVVLLSHGLWKRRFGSDPLVVGRALTLDD